jgi:hypothetical protein
VESFCSVIPIPSFHATSEALMSNLASRPHEWRSWEIKELLFKVFQRSKRDRKRNIHFRVCLIVDWIEQGQLRYVLRETSSPTKVLLERESKKGTLELKEDNILSMREKNSRGQFFGKNAELFEKFLT